MNQKCLSKIEKIAATFVEVTDALDHLKTIVENDEEDRIEEAMDMFPSPAQLTRSLEHLGQLIETRPWESKRKRDNA